MGILKKPNNTRELSKIHGWFTHKIIFSQFFLFSIYCQTVFLNENRSVYKFSILAPAEHSITNSLTQNCRFIHYITKMYDERLSFKTFTCIKDFMVLRFGTMKCIKSQLIQWSYNIYNYDNLFLQFLDDVIDVLTLSQSIDVPPASTRMNGFKENKRESITLRRLVYHNRRCRHHHHFYNHYFHHLGRRHYLVVVAFVVVVVVAASPRCHRR